MSARAQGAGATERALTAGSGEFYLMQQGSDDIKLVVRTINSSAFTQLDWDEYAVSVSRVPSPHSQNIAVTRAVRPLLDSPVSA